jgi:hypothetical protein
LNLSIVVAGLDPVIHHIRKKMDARVISALTPAAAKAALQELRRAA